MMSKGGLFGEQALQRTNQDVTEPVGMRNHLTSGHRAID